MISISSRPSAPSSPAWGLKPATARRGARDSELALEPARRGAALGDDPVDVEQRRHVAQRHMGGDRDDLERRAGQHHRHQLARDPAAFGDEFGLAGMG